MDKLEEIKVEIESLRQQLGSPYDLTVVQAQLDSARQFIKTLEAEVESLRIQLEAWQSVFETSQLSHAQARLEAAEREVESLRATVKVLNDDWAIDKACLDREITDLQSQLAEARGALPKGLSVRCCDDGVWLELRADTGRSACINLSNMGKDHLGNIIPAAILEWCEQTALAKALAKE